MSAAYKVFQDALAGKTNESLFADSSTTADRNAMKTAGENFQKSNSGLPKEVNERIGAAHTKGSTLLDKARESTKGLETDLAKHKESLKSLSEIKDGKRVGSAEAIAAAEKSIKETSEKLGKEKAHVARLEKRVGQIEKVSDTFNSGKSELKAGKGKIKTAQNPTTVKHYETFKDSASKVIDAEKVAKAEKAAIEKAAGSTTKTAAAAKDGMFGAYKVAKEGGKGMFGAATQATTETFGNTWKNNKLGFAGKSVVTAGGAITLYDALSRSKNKDGSDRSFVGRLGEGAVGAAALTAGLVGGRARA